MTNKDKNKKKPDIIAEVAYKNEQQVNSGQIEEPQYSTAIKQDFEVARISTLINGEKKIFDYVVEFDGTKNTTTALNNLREVYSQSNNSVDETYAYLKNQILENPNNIDALIRDLSQSLLQIYDSNINLRDIGESTKEQFETILKCPEGEELEGFVCMGIHEFGMNLLHDCNIPAVVLCGFGDGDPHATLLYQKADGKFVYNNYGVSMEIEAPSLIDAIKTVYKKSGDLGSAGYIKFLDEDNSYIRIAFEQEALWAEELDKSGYNKNSPFSNVITSSKTEISARNEISNLGNFNSTVSGNLAYGTDKCPHQTAIGLGYKSSRETALFDKSKAVGIKLQHNVLNNHNQKNKTFFKVKMIGQAIQCEDDTPLVAPKEFATFSTDSEDFRSKYEQFLRSEGVEDASEYLNNVATQTISPSIGGRICKYSLKTFFSTFIRGVLGNETTLLDKDNLEIKNSTQLSAITNSNSMFGTTDSDFRTTFENGVELTVNGKNWILDSFINAGYVNDLKKNGGTQKLGLQSGGKLNSGITFMAKPNENADIIANIEANTVNLKPYQDYGVSTSLFASQKVAQQKNIYGQVSYSKYVQNINIGGFSGKSIDKATFGATIGAQLKNTNVYATYNKSINGINKTYNNSTFAIGAKIGL